MSRIRTAPSPLGLTLANLRVTRGLSQKELAARSGKPVTSIRAWESGARSLGVETLTELAETMEFERLQVEGLVQGLRGVIEPFEPLPGTSLAITLPPEAVRRVRLEAVAHGLTQAQERESQLQAEACAHQISRERSVAEAFLRRLLPLPPEEREARRVRTCGEGFHTWAFVERACEQSVRCLQARPCDLQGARDWALLALHSTFATDPAHEQRMMGYAFAFLGHVKRATGEYEHAANSFGYAAEYWREGWNAQGLPLAEWRMHELEAALHRDQGEGDGALLLHEKALSVAAPEEWPLVLLGKAETHEGLAQPREALDTLFLAQQGLKEGHPDDLRFLLTWKTADLLSRLGRSREALQPLIEARTLALDSRKEDDLSLCLWLQGRCAAAQQEGGKATRIYLQARADLLAERRGPEALECTLELAELQERQGETEAAERLVKECAWARNLDGLAPPVRECLQRLDPTLPKGEDGLCALQQVLAELRRSRPRTRP